MEKDKMVIATKVLFNVTYHDDGGTYNFDFLVKEEEATQTLALVLSLLPGENIASLNAGRGNKMFLSESSLDTRETIMNYMYTTFNLGGSKLTLEKGGEI